MDYVLLRDNSEVLPVYAYRDGRTEAVISPVHEKMPFSVLYRHTGCQFQPFNSIYQLYADKLEGRLEGVTDLLMVPEYLLWKFCGVKAREYHKDFLCAKTSKKCLYFTLDLALVSKKYGKGHC